MAVTSNRNLKSEETKVKMASYDRKIALANFFPSISATGGYIWNQTAISLVSEETSDNLRHAGDKLREVIGGEIGDGSAFQIAVDEIFPGIMILGLMLP